MQQFIHNDKPKLKTDVDHIIKKHENYNWINNLRWTTKQENNVNKSGRNGIVYELVSNEQIPDDLIKVTEYHTHIFSDDESLFKYYYSPSTNKFYFNTGVEYRILPDFIPKSGNAYVKMRDNENHYVSVYYHIYLNQLNA